MAVVVEAEVFIRPSEFIASDLVVPISVFTLDEPAPFLSSTAARIGCISRLFAMADLQKRVSRAAF